MRAIRVAVDGSAQRRLGAMLASLVVVAMLTSALGSSLAGAETTSKPVNTEAPKLTGTATVASNLSCSQGGWLGNPTSYTYEWLRDGAAIAGQSANTYTVQNADQGHSISCAVIAGNAGGYVISGLPSGSYKVSFFAGFETAGSYLEQWFNGKTAEAEATLVAVTAPNTTTGINAALQPAGQITGRVTAASGGAPLANFQACARQNSSEATGGCANTNANGEYVIVGLSSGSYTVTASPGFGETANFLSQTSGPVSVTAPSSAGPVDLALPAGGEISGTVTAETGGGAIAGAQVCAEASNFELNEGCATTNASGEYTIVGLATASYTVRFVAPNEGNYITQFYNEQATEEKATPVEATAASNKTGIDAKLKTGGEISGKVTAESGGAALPGLQVCASSSGGEGQSNSCATTNGSGEYLIVGLGTGEYKVSFAEAESGPYLSTSMSGVKVTAPAVTFGVDAALQLGGQISGRVTAATGGAPISHVSVCAGGEESFSCASTNANGEYAVIGLATGSYTVSFSAPEETGNYLSSTTSGVSVTAPNATGPVNAALQTGGQISGNVTAAGGGQPLTNVFVSASNEKGFGFAATGAGGATSTGSNALAIPAPLSTFSVRKKAVFNPKNDDLEFFFTVANAGKFSWSLFFKNSDVAFASSLNLGGVATELAVAEAAKKHKSKKCKKGQIKHRGKCVRELVAFGSGSQSVAGAGNVTVKVHASAQAIKGLKAGHTLHVSGVFTFQSSLGGAPVKHTESAVVKLHKKKSKKHHKH